MTPNDRTEPGVCTRCRGNGENPHAIHAGEAHCQYCNGTGRRPAQPRRCCRKHEAEDLNGNIFGRTFIVCPTCQDKRCAHAEDCAKACTGQKPAQPATDERGRPMTYWGGQPAQPESGEVKRYTPNSIANEIMAEDAWHDSQWVRAADYDRLQSALTAAQERIADGLEAWKANNAHFAARIAELREALRTYGWHKPECDYMQEELPCTCGFLTAVERDFPGGA